MEKTLINDAVSGQSQQNPLTRKVNKILETRLESDKELVDALKALSSFFEINSLRTRRNLRGDVEKRSLNISEQFESQFREVKEQLDSIYGDIQSMSQCCIEMTDRLKKSKESTSELISKTTKLRNERKRVEMQEKMVKAFLDKFQLKPDEIKALRIGREGSITEDFFIALAHCKQIHKDCRVLLRSNQQKAGLEIMESMALYQETAYEKLYRWAQGECRTMTSDMPDVSGAMCRAMEALQDRHVLFKYTLDELAAARRTAVVRCFIDALTRGGSGGSPRPIELYSHDPIRYVGDILAWLHQCVAGEKELLHSLLRKTRLEEHKALIVEILNHVVEGVCRPFKVRVEQIVTSEPGPATLFKLGNLLKFYMETLRGLLVDQSALMIVTVQEMCQLSHQMFFNSLNCHGTKLTDKIDIPPPDLSPSKVVLDTLELVKDVLSSHSSALTHVADRQRDYEKVLSSLLDPLLQCCMLAASRLNKADMATYMVNCLYQMQTTLALYEFTDTKIEFLAAQTEAHLETLAVEQASFVLSRAGLGIILHIIREHEGTNVAMSSLKDVDAISVKAAMVKFDSYLSAPDSYHMPQSDLIRSPRIRDTVHKKAVDLVCANYETVHKAVFLEKNKYENPSSLIVRTPDEVRTLLA